MVVGFSTRVRATSMEAGGSGGRNQLYKPGWLPQTSAAPISSFSCISYCNAFCLEMLGGFAECLYKKLFSFSSQGLLSFKWYNGKHSSLSALLFAAYRWSKNYPLLFEVVIMGSECATKLSLYNGISTVLYIFAESMHIYICIFLIWFLLNVCTSFTSFGTFKI